MSNKSSIEFYKELFMLQDRVLKIVNNLETKFYLTGGTALSRFYLKHRYSDDLDFVSHKNPYFGDHIQAITDALVDDLFDVKPFGISSTFANLQLVDLEADERIKLKVDFINEKKAPRFGPLHSSELYSRVDNTRNILSNKISILSRQQPKDVADIWFICKHLSFRWDEIIEEASQKRVLEEIFVVESLRTFPHERLSTIKWIEPVNVENFKSDCETIIENIVTKSENKLFSGPGK